MKSNICSTIQSKTMILDKKKVLALLFLKFIGFASASAAAPYERYGKAKVYLFGCQNFIRTVATFCDLQTQAGVCQCVNSNSMSTFIGCLEMLNAPKSAYSAFVESCAEYNYTISDDTISAAYKNYTDYAEYPSQIPGFNYTEPVNVPVRLNRTAAVPWIKSYVKFLGNYDNSLYYGSGLLGYWALVFLLAAATNWGKLLFPKLFKQLTGPISNTWRKWITLPALGSRKRTQDHQVIPLVHYLIPSRLETIILLGFTVVAIACCSAQITYLEGDPIFLTKRMALLRYTADRAGICLTVFQPLLFLFAGRNNFLQWFTRWKFSTFITFHRWVGRILFALLFTHAVCYTCIYVERQYYSDEIKIAWFHWGIIATIFAGLLMFQALLFFRRYSYEAFALLHILFAALFVAGGWIHVKPMGYIYFYYAIVAVWAHDWFLRLVRIFIFGFPKAEVKLYANEVLKITIPRPKYWRATPGGHAFIHFFRPSCFWQSHPFTFTVSPSSGDKIVIYSKVKGGVTHGLHKYLSANPERTATIKVALEGPYGGPTPARKFDSAVFIAGGNGIPGIYSEVFDLATKAADNSTQVLKLHWCIRGYDSIAWFYDELSALKNTKVQTTVYITRPDSEVDADFINELSGRVGEIIEKEKCVDIVEETKVDYSNDESDKKSDTDIDSLSENYMRMQKLIDTLSHIRFRETRPSMEKIVKGEIRESPGSTCFITCGHPQMVDDIRYNVVRSLDDSEGKRVDFFEQLQVWA